MKRDLYAEVSTRIVAELEAGAAPWVKPWSATPGANTPCNAATNRPYSGCNVILLWMAQAAGYPPEGQATGPFATSYAAYHHAMDATIIPFLRAADVE